MAVVALPSYAHVRELRLAIRAPTDEIRRPLTLRARYSTPFREMWMGTVLFAAATIRNTRAIAAWVEALDGRMSPFRLPFPAGVFSQACPIVATLASSPEFGADELLLDCATPGMLRAGTLLTLGDIESDEFQLFEILQDTTAGNDVAVPIAPRVRREFTINSAVALGAVTGKFKCQDDKVDASLMISHGLVTLPVIEAL